MVTPSKIKNTLSVVNPGSDTDADESVPVTTAEDAETIEVMPDTPAQNEAPQDIQ